MLCVRRPSPKSGDAANCEARHRRVLHPVALVLGAVRGVPRAARVIEGRGDGRGDWPELLLALATRDLRAARVSWGQAMLAELASVHDAAERRRLSLGCTWAVTTMRFRDAFSAGCHKSIRAVVLIPIAAVLALAGYGLARYPALALRPRALGRLACLVVLLSGYTAVGLTVARGTARVRLAGLSGGLLLGATWLHRGPVSGTKAMGVRSLLAALLIPAVLAIRISTSVALWAGTVGGLLSSIVLVSVAYLDGGRPYDAQLVRDYHAAGAHGLAAYSVGGTLSTALALLLIIPLVAAAFGSAGARLMPSTLTLRRSGH